MASALAIARQNEEIHQDLLDAIKTVADRVGIGDAAHRLEAVQELPRRPEETRIEEKRMLVQILQEIDAGIADRESALSQAFDIERQSFRAEINKVGLQSAQEAVEAYIASLPVNPTQDTSGDDRSHESGSSRRRRSS